MYTGLDAAGKTTILYKLKLGEVVTTIPTIGEQLYEVAIGPAGSRLGLGLGLGSGYGLEAITVGFRASCIASDRDTG